MTLAERRHRVNAFMSYLIATDQEMGNRITTRDELGRRTYVVALEGDRVHDVSTSAARLGEAATVIVLALDSDKNVKMSMMRMKARVTADQMCDDSHIPVGPNTTMGDMLSVLHLGCSITVSLSDHEELCLDPVPGETSVRDGEDFLVG